MIQPQELRIGNYIEYNGEIIKLDGSLLCCYIQNELDYPFNEVPLTEEILLKFGFNEVEGERWCDMHEEFEECNYYYLSMFKIYYNPETDRFEDDSLYHFNVNLKYVHQLQNLFFILCGGELTFKN